MRKRSKHRPKEPNKYAHIMAMMGASKMSKDDALRRASALHFAVDDAATGKGTKESWGVIFDSVNVVAAMIRKGIVVRELAPWMEELQTAIEGVLRRQKDTGTRALRSSELQALRDFAASYADVLCEVTQQQYWIAQQAVEQMYRRILAGERLPNAHIVPVPEVK